ncbi:MAG: Lrp/AsnC family transcriptional regulator [Candidatus Micrarchaeota archaeon]|nr:Lrp/AsnC family transcriptional regulator [Candidatus Micrarchaeota archaeon]MDE1824399.1 Lrp/AsnC family transcriptional regulator [Candidatus Micrarchaeota archaeon]MDE1849878.1 Lrp/AsnC family transcriptional regulator [Candidatus Micrarchaeota archaeon]
MKDTRSDLVRLIKSGYCAPRIAGIAKRLRQPATTIHYNIKQMEREKVIRTYKAVFDYKKIDEGFCTYVLISLAPEEYADPERIAKELAKFEEVESVDVITGGWEIIVKIRTENIEAYYGFMRTVLTRRGIAKTTSLNSMRQLKSEFVEF